MHYVKILALRSPLTSSQFCHKFKSVKGSPCFESNWPLFCKSVRRDRTRTSLNLKMYLEDIGARFVSHSTKGRLHAHSSSNCNNRIHNIKCLHELKPGKYVLIIIDLNVICRHTTPRMSIFPTIESTGSCARTDPNPNRFSLASIAPMLCRKSIDKLIVSIEGICESKYRQ